MPRRDEELVVVGAIPSARPQLPAARAPARAACMLALAHRLEEDLSTGAFDSGEGAARALGLTGARISRLLRLTLLAPDIQEEVLFLETVDGCEPVHEKWLCDEVAAIIDWNGQRAVWRGRTPPRRRYGSGAAEAVLKRRIRGKPRNHFSRINEPRRSC
jgi:hypothetical protein